VPRPFLTARWCDLLLLTFEAPPDLIGRLVPAGVEPDHWQGRTHVSLVALGMRHVRLRGWPVPGFDAHLQVNFRTYVRYRGEPGVWFIREFVPSRLLAAVAWLKFGEPFGTTPIHVHREEQEASVRASYQLGRPELGWHLTIAGSRATRVPPPESAEHYFKERVLACRARRDGGLATFRVEHPPWAVREVMGVDYRVDFGFLYGADWRFLNDARPVSAIFSPGSEVTVYPPRPAARP
jgi:uncharacterized protein YqjF (DUF2071 family)